MCLHIVYLYVEGGGQTLVTGPARAPLDLQEDGS